MHMRGRGTPYTYEGRGLAQEARGLAKGRESEKARERERAKGRESEMLKRGWKHNNQPIKGQTIEGNYAFSLQPQKEKGGILSVGG